MPPRRGAMRPLIISSRLQFAADDGDGWLLFHRCSADLHKVRPHLHAAAITSPEQYFSGTLCELSRRFFCWRSCVRSPQWAIKLLRFWFMDILSDVIALVILVSKENRLTKERLGETEFALIFFFKVEWTKKSDLWKQTSHIVLAGIFFVTNDVFLAIF